MTVDYLRARATGGNRKNFEGALKRVPDVEPEEHDHL